MRYQTAPGSMATTMEPTLILSTIITHARTRRVHTTSDEECFAMLTRQTITQLVLFVRVRDAACGQMWAGTHLIVNLGGGYLICPRAKGNFAKPQII